MAAWNTRVLSMAVRVGGPGVAPAGSSLPGRSAGLDSRGHGFDRAAALGAVGTSAAVPQSAAASAAAVPRARPLGMTGRESVAPMRSYVHGATQTSASRARMQEIRALSSPQLTASHFEVVETLGHGSTGQYLRVRCHAPGLPDPCKEYALKVCYELSESFTEHEVQQRRAVEALTAVQHAHAVPLLAAFRSEIDAAIMDRLTPAAQQALVNHARRTQSRLVLFLVFECYRTTLAAQRSTLPRPLPWEWLSKWVLQVATLQCFLAGKGIVHRDLKPSSILLSASGDVKVAGFGSSVRFSGVSGAPSGGAGAQSRGAAAGGAGGMSRSESTPTMGRRRPATQGGRFGRTGRQRGRSGTGERLNAWETVDGGTMGTNVGAGLGRQASRPTSVGFGGSRRRTAARQGIQLAGAAQSLKRASTAANGLRNTGRRPTGTAGRGRPVPDASTSASPFSYMIPFITGVCVGGAPNRIAPEILETLSHTGVMLDFRGQTVWETGLLCYELALGRHPLRTYAHGNHSSSGVRYAVESLPRLPAGVYPATLSDLLRQAMNPSVRARPSPQEFLERFTEMVRTFRPPVKVARVQPRAVVKEVVKEEVVPEPVAPETERPPTPPRVVTPPKPEPVERAATPEEAVAPWRAQLEGHGSGVSCMLLVDSMLLAGAHDGSIRAWAVDDAIVAAEKRVGVASSGATAPPVSRTPIGVLSGHSDAVCALTHVVGNIVASSSCDRTVRVWSLSDWSCLATLEGHTELVKCLVMAGPTTLVSAGSDNTVRTWRVPVDGKSGSRLGGPAVSKSVLRGHKDWVQCLLPIGDPVWGVVSGSADNTLRLWETSGGSTDAMCVLEGHTNAVHGVAMLSRSVLVTASSDETLKLWDIESGKCRLTCWGHRGPVTCVAALGPWRFVSGSEDTDIRVWDVDPSFPSETASSTLHLTGHVDHVRFVCGSGAPPGSAAADVVVSTARFGCLKVWRLGAEPRCVLTWRDGEDTFIPCCIVARGGSLLATGSSDHRVKLWPALADAVRDAESATSVVETVAEKTTGGAAGSAPATEAATESASDSGPSAAATVEAQ